MRALHFLIILLFVLLHTTSCSEDDFTKFVDVELQDEDHRLVLLADFIRNDDITISQTQSALAPRNRFLSIDDALVQVISPDQEKISLTYSDSTYGVNINFEPNATYSITVDHPSFPSLFASTKVPSAPEVTLISASKGEDEFGFFTTTYEIVIDDPADEKNYYSFSGIEYEVQSTSGDTFAQPVYLDFNQNDLQDAEWLADIGFNGNQRTVKLRSLTFRSSQPEIIAYSIIIHSLPEEKIKYEESVELVQEAEENPFVEPTILYTNVEGGFGIFAISSFVELKGSF